MIRLFLALASGLSLLAGLYYGGLILMDGGSLTRGLWPVIGGALVAAFLSPVDR